MAKKSKSEEILKKRVAHSPLNGFLRKHLKSPHHLLKDKDQDKDKAKDEANTSSDNTSKSRD